MKEKKPGRSFSKMEIGLLKWLPILLWVGALSAIVLGCQSPKKGNLPPSTQGEPQISGSGEPSKEDAFKIRVVTHGKDRELPLAPSEEPDAPTGSGKEFVIQGKEMVLDETIEVGRSNGKTPAAFLEWSEKAFGSIIENALFEHRVQDSANRIQGDADRIPVSYDSKHHRWFISLEKLFRGHETELNSADLHWITLDFLLKDRTRRSIRLGFHFMGPPPALLVERLEVGGPGVGALSFVQSASREGWVVGREIWTNPTARKLNFWLRPSGASSLRLRTQISSSHYDERPHDIPVLSSVNDYHESVAPFRLNSVQIFSENGQLKSAFGWVPNASGWEQVQILPGEKLTLVWSAVPQTGLPPCSVPSSGPRQYFWTLGACFDDRSGLGRYADASDCNGRYDDRSFPPLLASGVFQFNWALVGASLEGDLGRELRIAEPHVSPAEALERNAGEESDRVRVQKLAKISITISAGEPLRPAGAFSCHGVF